MNSLKNPTKEFRNKSNNKIYTVQPTMFFHTSIIYKFTLKVWYEADLNGQSLLGYFYNYYKQIVTIKKLVFLLICVLHCKVGNIP